MKWAAAVGSTGGPGGQATFAACGMIKRSKPT